MKRVILALLFIVAISAYCGSANAGLPCIPDDIKKVAGGVIPSSVDTTNDSWAAFRCPGSADPTQIHFFIFSYKEVAGFLLQQSLGMLDVNAANAAWDSTPKTPFTASELAFERSILVSYFGFPREVTSLNTVYSIVKQADRLVLLPVGTTAVGTKCDSVQGLISGYYVVPVSAVTFAGTVKPVVVFAQCF
jgi:hypothetical protein